MPQQQPWWTPQNIWRQANQFVQHPMGGSVVNWITNNLPGGYNDQYRQFRQDIDRSNQQGQNVLDTRVDPAVNSAQTLAQIGSYRGDQYFDPNSAVNRYNNAYGNVQAGLENLGGNIGFGNQQVQNMYGDVRSEFQQGGDQLLAGFRGQLGRARDIVGQAGVQERQEINQSFNEAGAASQQNLAARGLGGSTISGNLSQGNELQRSRALGGLNDRLTSQRLGVEQSFGGALLGAQQGILQGGTNLGVGQANALQQGNQFQASAQLGAYGQLGGIAGGQFGAYNNAAQNQLSNLGYFGGMGIDAQFAGAGMHQQYYGPQTFIQPTPNSPIIPQPYGG